MLNSIVPEFTLALFALVFVEGIVSFISPCILPMLPVYVGYFAGEATTIAGEKKKSHTLVYHTLAFIAGFTVVFALLGVTASALGMILTQHRLLIQRICGIVLVVFGLQLAGVFRFSFLNRETRFRFDARSLTGVRAALFGAVFSFGWTPCLGPFLGSALMFASNTDTLWQGAVLLCVFALGLGLPFLLVALLGESMTPVLRFFKKYHKPVRLISASILIIIGIAMTFDILGYYQRLFS